MVAKKRGLGRGLDALLGGAAKHQQREGSDVASQLEMPTTSLPVDLIQRGRHQPRRNFDPDSLRELVLERADAGMIAKAAAAGGMQSMFEDGLRKAIAGDTSIDEVLRVTQDSHQ